MKNKSLIIIVVIVAVLLGVWILLSSPRENTDLYPSPSASSNGSDIIEEIDSIDMGAELDAEFQVIDEDVDSL